MLDSKDPQSNQISINFTINTNFTTSSRDLKTLSAKDQNGDEIFHANPSPNPIVEIRNNSRYGNRVSVKNFGDNVYMLTIRDVTLRDEGEIVGHILYQQTNGEFVEYFVEQTIVHLTVQGKRSSFYQHTNLIFVTT